jgi:uncharacterized protein (TIGR02246 family)
MVLISILKIATGSRRRKARVAPYHDRTVDRSALEDWLARYGRAWEMADPDAAVALFTEDATYRETPFDEVMSGHDAIRAYWSDIPEYHRDVSFRWVVLDVREDRAIVHWRTTYTAVKTGKPTTLDGIFVLEFDESSGRCRTLREWWHGDPAPGF